MAARDLRRARRARRRLSAAGWLTVATGALIGITTLVLAPFLFPFGLAAGALAMLAGVQLVRLRGALGAVGAAGVGLVVAGATAAQAAGSPSSGVALVLAGLLGACALAVLLVVYADAGHLPSPGATQND